MEPSNVVRVNICCIATRREADTAVRAGADALGLVSEMPSGPGVISLDSIAGIVPLIPPGVSSFLLTSKTRFEDIARQITATGVGVAQLVDRVDGDVYRELRDAFPRLRLVQVVHVMDESAIGEAEAVAPLVDAVLLDSGDTRGAVKELGGTGRRHDWSISKRIRERIAKPVFLAGGLEPGNVVEAMETVRPFGLDICSGVRTDGRLDENKLRWFIAAVRTAEAMP